MSKRLSFWGSAAVAIAAMAGCSGGSGSGVGSGLEASERYVADRAVRVERPASPGNSTRETAGPFATVAGSSVDWERVKPLLAEAAGGIVLEEVALEMMLEGEMRRRGLRLTPAMVEREQLLLRESLESDDASGNADEAQRLLDQIRRQRGLGPERYEALLRRTAMLRALVQDRVQVDPVSVERAYRIRYEPRMRVRIITADTVEQAERARQRVLAGEAFSRVAAEVSTDVSSVRGGVIEPISPSDPTYPDALRSAIARMSVGEVSRPIVMEVDGPAQVAVVVLDEIVRPERTPALESVRAELERLVRLREERLLMDALSRRLLGEARVTPMDDAAMWSWRSRSGG
ncbi:MAG: peptidyl-prolyl cis-trans isomerase [Phycisphaerales bacterium]